MFPKDIPDIEDRLRNRFQWGLIADIQAPSIEHRIAILYSKAEKLGIRLRPEVAEYVAKHAKRNVRELEGALHRINAYGKLQGEEITLDLAARTFRDVLGEAPKRMSIDTVQKVVAEHFQMKVADLKSKRRQRAIAMPRQIAMYLSRKLTNASYPDIGDKFGGKDHTTVMHNVKKIEESLDRDLDLKAHIDALERHLEQLQ
jgi:chromosomal replication initiator protein